MCFLDKDNIEECLFIKSRNSMIRDLTPSSYSKSETTKSHYGELSFLPSEARTPKKMSRRSSLVFAFLKAFPASMMPGKSLKNLRNSAIAEINQCGEVFSSFLFESDLELFFFAGSFCSIGAVIC
ncbi:hypothetical protein TNCV_317621 [Trichonephila clavipes]|nr:hypothetical protein TNCV_317621 [Trichonephila clavipes]